MFNCSSPRQRRTFAVHPLRLHDIAAHLRSIHCLYDIAAPLRSTHLSHQHRCAFAAHPLRLHDIAAHLRLIHFVSTTSPHPCGTLFRLYDHLHPLCLTDIAVHLRFTHCLTDTVHLRFILFGLYDFTPHHSTSTFYLSGISRTRGSVRLFVIALACPRTYLRIRTVV
jgi:hypothetical protein